MKKKPPICQVRISPDLAETIDLLRANCNFKISRSEFVQTAIRAGIPVIRQWFEDKSKFPLGK